MVDKPRKQHERSRIVAGDHFRLAHALAMFRRRHSHDPALSADRRTPNGFITAAAWPAISRISHHGHWRGNERRRDAWGVSVEGSGMGARACPTRETIGCEGDELCPRKVLFRGEQMAQQLSDPVITAPRMRCPWIPPRNNSPKE